LCGKGPRLKEEEGVPQRPKNIPLPPTVRSEGGAFPKEGKKIKRRHETSKEKPLNFLWNVKARSRILLGKEERKRRLVIRSEEGKLPPNFSSYLRLKRNTKKRKKALRDLPMVRGPQTRREVPQSTECPQTGKNKEDQKTHPDRTQQQLRIMDISGKVGA